MNAIAHLLSPRAVLASRSELSPLDKSPSFSSVSVSTLRVVSVEDMVVFIVRSYQMLVGAISRRAADLRGGYPAVALPLVVFL